MTARLEDPGFGGRIGRSFEDSSDWWPPPLRARPGAPNVVFVVLDDVGFAQLGCFGSDLDTPHLDRLADSGLRFTNFHTTALCSPTRACLLTGRNHHSNGMGRIIELATGFPGYNARIPFANGLLSEMLLPHGYATFAVGKWHLTPEDECNMAAPRDRWPLGRGFERFYGFMEGETHQNVPALVSDNHQIHPPRRWEDGYHLTEDLVDTAAGFLADLRAVDDAKPFFLYLCPGACHAPHQAPPEYIEAYRGRFDAGWDAWREATLSRQLASGVLPPGTRLSPRPGWVPAWEDLGVDEKKVYARYMEAFAGFLTHTDRELGRFFDYLEATGEAERTITVVISDNGASSEGGPFGSVNDVRQWNVAPRTVAEALARLEEIGGPWCHNNYPWGWTVAGNTPFKRWKRETHEGGVADPLIVHWPSGIAEPGLRRQYVHAIDVVPTVLELIGVEPPTALGGIEQSPVEGVSFVSCLGDARAPGLHRTQYYEMFGCRAIYHEGFKAVTYHPIQDTRTGFDEDTWELYHVEVDPSECDDLAGARPEKLEELVALWWKEAERYRVLPLDNRAFSEFVLAKPHYVPERQVYLYRPGAAAVPEAAAVNLRNRSHSIRAEIEVPTGGCEGVLLAQGSGLGGWAFFVEGNRPVYLHNYVSLEEHRIEGGTSLPSGPHHLTFHFACRGDNSGTGRIEVDGTVVGEGEIPLFTPMRFSLTGAGLTCGYGDGLPVARTMPGTFPFSGLLHRVVVQVEGEPFSDPDADASFAIARQ